MPQMRNLEKVSVILFDTDQGLSVEVEVEFISFLELCRQPAYPERFACMCSYLIIVDSDPVRVQHFLSGEKNGFYHE